MKIPYKPLAVRAAAAAPRADYPTPLAGSSLVISGNGADGVGFVHFADFDGSSINFGAQAQVQGAPTWITQGGDNMVYVNNENEMKMTRYQLQNGNGTGMGLGQVELSNGDAADEEMAAGQVHMALNREQTRLVTAAYGAGNVAVYDIEGGAFELTQVLPGTANNGSESNPHQVVLDPSGQTFTIPNLGADTIMLVSETEDGSFEVYEHVPAQAGCGPRHGIFHPQDAEQASHYFVSCELSGEMASYAVTYGESGQISLEHLGSQPSSDDGSDSFPSETLLSADGKNLYVGNRFVERANRTTDTISHFVIDDEALLVKQGEYETGGLTPRKIALGCDGQCMLIGHQGPNTETPDLSGNGVTIMAINEEGGLATDPLATVPLSHFGGGVFFIDTL